jgi:glutaconate CoA-transferase subunit A
MSELKDKSCSLAEAARLIENGARIALGGFSLNNRPMAFVYELIRKGIKDLTIIGHISSIETDALVGAGCVKRIETSYVGLEEFGMAPNFRRAVERGELEVIEYSEDLAFGRFMCSARGESFFPTYGLFGTDLPKYNKDIKAGVNPVDGSKYHAIPAADPDWVVIHAPMGDKYGNILYFDHRQMPEDLDLVMTRASNNLIVTVEQIVDTKHTFRLPFNNVVPKFRTTAVVGAPYGAHPSACTRMYDYDKEHLKLYSKAAKEPDRFKEYLNKYAYGVKSHMDYLKLIGVETLVKLRFVGGNL